MYVANTARKNILKFEMEGAIKRKGRPLKHKAHEI